MGKFALYPNFKSRVVFTWLLSALLAGGAFLIYLYLDPFPIHPYRLALVGESPASPVGTTFFDLTADGVGEKINFMSYNNFPVVEVYTHKNEFMQTFRFRGEWLGKYADYLTADLDGDGFGEIYILTLDKDSIFLNGFEPFGDGGHFLVDLFLDVTQKVDGKYDVSAPFITSHDTNGNGTGELIIVISAGYSLFPRKVYRYDLQQNTLDKTPPVAARKARVSVFDVDGDGKKELFVSCNATENFKNKDGVLYSDTAAWIFGYKNSLDSIFLTLEFSEEKSYLDAFVKKTEDGIRIFVNVYKQNSHFNELHVYDLDGVLLKKITLDEQKTYAMVNSAYPDIKHITLISNYDLRAYNDQLEPVYENSRVIKFVWNHFPTSLDENNRVFYVVADNNFIIMDDDFSILGMLTVDDFSQRAAISVSQVQRNGPQHYVLGVYDHFIQMYHIEVKRNYLYPFRFLIKASVFPMLFLIFHSLLLIQNYFIRKRYANEMLVVSLQMQSIQNQLQPHFTFNVLNNIGALLHRGENDMGYRYLTDFSDMLRIVMTHNIKMNWMLKDEIQFISSYIRMENLRYSNKFNFEIACKENALFESLVPKLMIQTFAENSIRHGLVHKSGDCALVIAITNYGEHMRVIISDNGIGREAAARLIRKGTGRGILMIREFMDAYNKIHDKGFFMNIADLFDVDGNPSGTRITLDIPLNYNL